MSEFEEEMDKKGNYFFKGSVDNTSASVILTNDFIFIKSGYIRKSERKIYYQDISSIKFRKGFITDAIVLFGQGLQEKSTSKPRYGASFVLQLESNIGYEIGNIQKNCSREACERIEKEIKSATSKKETNYDDPIKILKIRLAKGEISKEEYNDLKKELG